MYYFELFDIPVSLKIDTAIILKTYYQLSRKFHPDNFGLDNFEQQTIAIEKYAQINKAKNILENKQQRLYYILTEKGIIIEDEKYNLSPLFLSNMMDINEDLMELTMEKNEEKLNYIKSQIEKIEQDLYSDVESYFLLPNLETETVDWAKLKEFYYCTKYLDRIKEKL